MLRFQPELNGNRLLRLPQIIGGQMRKGAEWEPIIPVSKSTWWKWVKEGKAPKPIKQGAKITMWHEDEIAKFIETYRSR